MTAVEMLGPRFQSRRVAHSLPGLDSLQVRYQKPLKKTWDRWLQLARMARRLPANWIRMGPTHSRCKLDTRFEDPLAVNGIVRKPNHPD